MNTHQEIRDAIDKIRREYPLNDAGGNTLQRRTMKPRTRKFYVEWKDRYWRRSASHFVTKKEAIAYADRLLTSITPRRFIEVTETIHKS